MSQFGYYRYPTVSGDRVVFVCEDDLWSVPIQGGIAVRLTANLGMVQRPLLSPDGQHLAFVGREEGHSEVYCMPAMGGVAKRLTFMGSATVAAWTPAGNGLTDDGSSDDSGDDSGKPASRIVFSSNAGQPFYRMEQLYTIDPQGGLPEKLPYGLAHSVAFGANGGVVLGRNTGEPAFWKRYRGGRVGVLWIDPMGEGNFNKLIDLNGNLTAPMWIGERIYFLADHEGIGNLYSCTPAGQDLQRHTHQREYYLRNATTDGRRIVYHAGAELFCFDPVAETEQPIEVEFYSPRIQRQRKFVEAATFLETYDLHPEVHSVAITTRGKSFCFGNWEGAVFQLGRPEEGRYRLTRWLSNDRLVGVCDRSGVETLEILSPDFAIPPEPLSDLDIGRVIGLEVSPTAEQVILTNHRQEIIWVDLVSKASKLLDRSEFERIHGFSWSPDGEWVAYSCAETQHTLSIKLCRISDGSTYLLTPPRFRDVQPAFDPGGKFIYFLSARDFNPVYDRVYGDWSFPKAMRPFLISLQRDTPSPFVPVVKLFSEAKAAEKPEEPDSEADQPEADAEATEEKSAGKDKEQKKVEPLSIDIEGIEHRIVGFPVAEGIYGQVQGVEGKVLFITYPVQGSLDGRNGNKSDNKPTLEMYDFEAQKQERIASDVGSFRIGKDQKTLIYRSTSRLRVTNIAPQDRDRNKETEPGRKSGWLDLNRVKVSVNPEQEWPQMFREVWRLQQEQFWTADLSGVDWQRVYQRYRPLLDRVATRGEFADLVLEMQGELGTSHAYESGGDYRDEPNYRMGFLGADFRYDAATDGYRVEQIVRGDAWTEYDSPLNRLGVNVQEGDVLLAVNGQRVGLHCSPQELLVNQARTEVALTFAGETPDMTRTVTVKTLRSELSLRYRQWVERNYQQVQQATDGRVGYLHIPDMGASGYAEFHRYYFAEVHKAALIVDVRYNRGGNVSQLILEKLSRQRIGYNISRWGKPEPYPSYSIAGPIVAITDEHAASDGDIFSHSFKLMRIGTLVGKRTWGGVIGIHPRHSLVDQGRVTQPEFSFWFVDVGWKVENYGTDPDIEVEITPQDWAAGRDTQLEKAIEVVLQQLAQNPVELPDFGNRPYLPLPE